MGSWLIRGGVQGEFEQYFLEHDVVCLTWRELQDEDMTTFKEPSEIRQVLKRRYPTAPSGQISNHLGQITSFVFRMQPKDLVGVPLKGRAAIAIAEITGGYRYEHNAPFMFRHQRAVRWLRKDIPRSAFDPDILQGFSSVATIVQNHATDADNRIRAKAGAKPVAAVSNQELDESLESPALQLDLERSARDRIAQLIIQRYKGYGLERLVEGILKAQGYLTYHSPAGPDRGVDILAAPGSLGFGTPRICVQVKCTEGPVDHPTLSQLIGTMQTVKAQQGLLVSWGGFKPTVEKERANQFFAVRLWDQDDLIDELLKCYDKIDPDLRAELPLKQIWTVAEQQEQE
jgi:restriction system protein